MSPGILYCIHAFSIKFAARWNHYRSVLFCTYQRLAGSSQAEVDGFFQSLEILNMTSFGREVKPWVPRRRFTACKRIPSRN